jgi:separase
VLLQLSVCGNTEEVNSTLMVYCTASSSAITLHRELLEAIDWKLKDDEVTCEDTIWPTVSKTTPSRKRLVSVQTGQVSPTKGGRAVSISSMESSDEPTDPYKAYWSSLKAKNTAPNLFTMDNYDLSVLPANWAVITINVTEDRTTMFVSRHQRDHPPLVFCLPLDRQGRREGDSEEDLFTFDAARAELSEIIKLSDQGAREAKDVHDVEGKKAWWEMRHLLDKRMEELVANMEFVWLGAFKVRFHYAEIREAPG